ncbi:hypothetical protein AC482_03485 [miscellaneous Crenarchaeota group-15 archaeon DG-45]|uniref:ABC3 transporter permease C-terminal domain-containing protein n=1 Tax=miscellaneous Crenarchaeota group-15 archaeon DG-45 TaxID=1685127 RepID=A0A0M0BQD5_9ARCH|nr:MAG: hypothetical protein AC482_03485 [miscellaneous Crenarchaeota group-15 archaeon DG-45]
MVGGRRKTLLPLALILLLLLIAILPSAEAQTATLSGVVLDEDGSSIEGAVVSVWRGRSPVASTTTGADGRFYADVKEDARCSVYVFADDPSTPGVDYLPDRAEAEPANGRELSFRLVSAASLVLEGDIQFVESEELPTSVVYAILDPASEGVVTVSGFPLIYGSGLNAQTPFLGLEPSHLVVPAGVPFDVEVNASVLIERRHVLRSFLVDEPGHFELGRGERLAVDVRRHSLPFNLALVEGLHGGVETEIGDMEVAGFYLTAERATAASTARQLSEARYLYVEGLYIESFDAARRSYLELRLTLRGLEGMYADASVSVYILIALLSLTSTAVAFLMTNRDSTKLLSSPILFSASLAVLYLTYPGSGIISFEHFSASATLALAASLALAWVLPRFLRGRGSRGQVPVRNIIVPIFSLAKRGIRRRRLRFALTLASLAVLVMSFVSLTSFSEGYGLLISRVSGRGVPAAAVLLRAPGYAEESPEFIKRADIESGWLERQPESRFVSPKVENPPLPWPVATLSGIPIHGMVGVDPALEASMIDLRGLILDGELPSEGGIMIGESLRREMGVDVGDRLALDGVTVTLQGIFDDEVIRSLEDLDGSDYLPRKMVNVSPEGEIPNLVVEACEPQEVVITHISTALGTPFVGVSRVGIALEEGVDANAFAERMALERGYLAWASSSGGVYRFSLGGYLEGRGLPLMVPWVIVVLNVVVTMLNSMYERRREIHILSSVGINPAQIAAIFVAEASIIGVIAGGLGYLGGLGLYRAMAFFGLSLEVHQKISASWSLASIGIALTAILMGALAALRSSVVITPSLMRRWSFEVERENYSKPWETAIPVKLLREEVEGFVDFVVRDLKARESSPNLKTSSIRVGSEAEGAVRRIDFVYRNGQSSRFYTRNTLLIETGADGGVAATLRTYSDREWAHAAGTLVRMIAMSWSTTRGGTGGRS